MIWSLSAKGAVCETQGAAEGSWEFTLNGSFISITNSAGNVRYVKENYDQMDLTGDLTFNARSILTRGKAKRRIDTFLIDMREIEFDSRYKGYIVDRQTRWPDATKKYTRFTKINNSCRLSGKIAFKSRDFLDGVRFGNVYCELTGRLDLGAENGHLKGQCMQVFEMGNDEENSYLAIVDGTMTKIKKESREP